jgi:hypothetical protein
MGSGTHPQRGSPCHNFFQNSIGICVVWTCFDIWLELESCTALWFSRNVEKTLTKTRCQNRLKDSGAWVERAVFMYSVSSEHPSCRHIPSTTELLQASELAWGSESGIKWITNVQHSMNWGRVQTGTLVFQYFDRDHRTLYTLADLHLFKLSGYCERCWHHGLAWAHHSACSICGPPFQIQWWWSHGWFLVWL